MNPIEILRAVETVLVIDWPSKEVPELLAQARLRVPVRGGPGPEDYSIYQINNNDVNNGEVLIEMLGMYEWRMEHGNFCRRKSNDEVHDCAVVIGAPER